MRKRLLLPACSLSALLVCAWTGAAVANDDGGEIAVTPLDPGDRADQPEVRVGAAVPGRPAVPARSSHHRPARARALSCTYEPAPEWEPFLRRIHAAGIRRSGRPPDGRVDSNAALYLRVCGGASRGFVWIDRRSNGPAVPDPGVLARQAYSEVTLPAPTPRHSPDLLLSTGQHAVVVGEHTWIWAEPANLTPRTAQVRLGAVWAQVTATPVALVFDPGDGHAPISCKGVGTPFVGGRHAVHATSPDCDYVYTRSSYARAGGEVTATCVVRWRVTWTGSAGISPAGGVLPDMTSRTVVRFAVAEAQALVGDGRTR